MNIFGGVEPPSWLTAIAKPIDTQLTGHVLGSLASGLSHALQTDPETGKMKGVGEGLAETRMSQANPLWKLQAAQIQSGIAARAAQMESAHALALERTAETRAWMDDAPQLSPWLSAKPEVRETMAEPIAKSQQGMTLIQRTRDADARYFLGKEVNDTRLATSKLQLDNVKKAADWDNALGAADAETQASIAALPNQGWTLDANGKKVYPTPDALRILNDSRKASGLLPFGTKQTEVKKTDAMQVEAFRQANRMELEKMRQEDRLALLKARDTSKPLQPEIWTAPSGTQFLLYGKTVRSLDNVSAKEKAEISLLTSQIRGYQNQLAKDPGNQDVLNALSKKKAEFNRYFERKSAPTTTTPAAPVVVPAAPATPAIPAPAPATNQVAPPTSGGMTNISFDDFSKWKAGQ